MGTRGEKPPAEPEGSDKVHASSGRVEVDARGNSVWRWRKQSPLDTTSVLLKQLENDSLSLEATGKVARPGKGPTPGKAEPKRGASIEPERSGGKPRRRDSGGGFDPYNNG